MNDTLQKWLADEAALQTKRATVQPLVAGSAEAFALMAKLTGLQQLQSMLNGEFPAPSIGRTLDFTLIEVGPGLAVFQGTPGPAHLNPMGGIHGGWYASLLDSALGCCIHASLPVGKAFTTLELKVNLVRALGPKVQRVRATGRVVHMGGQTATSEARLEGPDGKLYAHGTSTCLVFDPRPTVAAQPLPPAAPGAKFES